nr:truncated tat protein [Human immunodeficiency virus 1]
MEPVDPKLEP